MTTAWLTRTGEGGYALHDCVHQGIAALRYHTVPEASRLAPDEIAEHLKRSPTVSDYTGVANMLVRFIHDVAIGDIVITPHAKERRVFFGEVTGPYEFADPAPVETLLHMRRVRWLGDLARDSIPKAMRKEIDQQRTFYAVSSNDYWLDRARQSTALKVRPPAKGYPPEAARNAVKNVKPRCAVCNIEISIAEAEVALCEHCLAE